MATAETHSLTLTGAMLERGFWLYVWRIQTPVGEMLYVGRTGDNSSPNAGSPFQRMGQHLSHRVEQNALRRNLAGRGIQPESCQSLELISHGPLFPEAEDMDAHRPKRDTVAALEKALADELTRCGYNVLNPVSCKKVLDQSRWAEVRRAFALHFPALAR